MTSSSPFLSLQKLVWDGSIALEICLAKSDCRTYDQSDPYLVREHICVPVTELLDALLFNKRILVFRKVITLNLNNYIIVTIVR